MTDEISVDTFPDIREDVRLFHSLTIRQNSYAASALTPSL
jgi:hypothetical protein